MAFCLERAGLMLGALACLATSEPEMYDHHPFLVNRTNQSEEITLTWLLRKVACDADLAALTASLNAADLDAPRPVNVGPGQVAALDLQPPAGRPPVGTCSNGPERPSWGATDCTAVVLAAREGTAALAVAARIRLAGSRSLCQPMRSPADDPGPEAVSIVESGAGLRFVGGSNVRLVEVSPAVIATRPPRSPGLSCAARAGGGDPRVRQRLHHGRRLPAAGCPARRERRLRHLPQPGGSAQRPPDPA